MALEEKLIVAIVGFVFVILPAIGITAGIVDIVTP